MRTTAEKKWAYCIYSFLFGLLVMPTGSLKAEVDLSRCNSIAKLEGRQLCYDRATKLYNNEADKRLFIVDFRSLVKEQFFVAAAKKLAPFRTLLDSNQLKLLEEIVLSEVRPIPSSAKQKNYDGYILLSQLDPNNVTYLVKIQKYSSQSTERQSLKGFETLSVKLDTFTGEKSYYHRLDSMNVNAGSRVSLLITHVAEKSPNLVLRTIYNADSWLWVNRVSVLVDGTSYQLTRGHFIRDNSNTIWEWRSEKPSPQQLFVLNKIAEGQTATLRFHGDEFYSDRKLSGKHKTAISEVLALYDALEDSRKLRSKGNTEKNYTPKKVVRSVGSKAMRCFDPSRRIVYSHSPFGMACASSDYPISDEDFFKMKNN
jgi:hypothetical protein